MLNNKAEFILEYNERKGVNLKKNDVDWSQSRVIFVAPSFTTYQRGAIAFKDLPIELWEVTLYQNNLILFNQIKPPEASESIQKVTKSKTVKAISQQVKTYTLDDHLSKASEEIKELFYKLREEIFELDERIQEKPVSWYIGSKLRYYNFCSIAIYKSKLKIYVRVKKIDDPKKKFRKISDKWTKTPLWYWDIRKDNEIDYAMTIIRQSYEAAPDNN